RLPRARLGERRDRAERVRRSRRTRRSFRRGPARDRRGARARAGAERAAQPDGQFLQTVRPGHAGGVADRLGPGYTTARGPGRAGGRLRTRRGSRRLLRLLVPGLQAQRDRAVRALRHRLGIPRVRLSPVSSGSLVSSLPVSSFLWRVLRPRWAAVRTAPARLP